MFKPNLFKALSDSQPVAIDESKIFHSTFHNRIVLTTSLHTGEAVKGRATRQCFKDESDINNIVAKATPEDLLPTTPPQYHDFSESLNFQEMSQKVAEAKSSFSDLSAELRYHFDNDPNVFFDFISCEENFDIAVDMGLLDPLPEEPEVIPEVTPPVPPIVEPTPPPVPPTVVPPTS